MLEFVFRELGMESEYTFIKNIWQSKRRTTFSGVVINTEDSRVYLQAVLDCMKVFFDLSYS
jgi:hypothetical protein